MSRPTDTFLRMDGASKLCFDKNEFMKKSFSVDAFLHENRHSGTLEEIRDDLGVYLKVLRSEMIELINEDYADFVNLSANLIGLDQSIAVIRSPLDDLRQELLQVKGGLSSNIDAIETFLSEKDELQRMQRNLKCLKRVDGSVKNLEHLLKSSTSSGYMERMTQEVVQLRNCLKYCEKHLSADKLKLVKSVDQEFMKRLKSFFLESIFESRKAEIETSLRIYSMLNEEVVANVVVRNELVKPQMSVVISEQSLQNSVQGLPGIYTRILELITSKMADLITISHKFGEKRFNFLINSFWTEIESRMEVNMTSIFAPGNPDFFYQKYVHTGEFLAKLESQLSSVQDFRQHKQYKSFQTRWNLPVYFQIRFQEIGGTVEGHFCRALTEKALVNHSSEVVLIPIKTAVENIKRCWSEGVYLEPLFSRFLKLTLQIYSRISIWSSELTKKANWKPNDWNRRRLDILMVLMFDLIKVKETIPITANTIASLMPKQGQEKSTLVDQCFEVAKSAVDQNLDAIETELYAELFQSSSSPIIQVTDIPRLYRKTNRDVPTKPCPYVEEVLLPAKKFYENYQQKIPEAKLKLLLLNLFSKLTNKFHSSVNDVLTSVQKTEESLRRLKTLRDKSTNPQALTSDKSGGISDDDKIRVQLFVDVLHWAKQIESFGLARNQIDKLEELLQLVNAFSKINTS